MKCMWHPFERGIGVCAFCLRERLLALTAPAPSPEHHIGKPTACSGRLPSPPPTLRPFPRSASPYGPRAAAAAAKSLPSSSILSFFFGRQRSGHRGHWLPQFLRRSRKKSSTSRMLSGNTYPAASVGDRGMSPESSRGWWPERAGWHVEYESLNPHRSGSPKALQKRAATAKRQNKAAADFNGISVCCSPLATTRPSRQRPRMAEVGFSGELIRPALGPNYRRHASTGGVLLGPDRSGKPVDFINFR